MDLKTRVNQLEINNVRNNVILKDLPLHSAARLGKESNEQTTEVVKEALTSLGIENPMFDAKRFELKITARGSRRNSTRSAPKPGILVKFANFNDKKRLFQGLMQHKSSSSSRLVQKIKVVDEYPKFLLEEYNSKEKMAFDFRKQHRGSKTKTRLKGQSIVLLAKKENETEFQELH